jgi:acyl-CoA synthetase (AMP-forming)/AMP-acid ligase II
VVHCRSGAETTAADIQRFCAERMAAYKVPAHVEMRSEPLPRNPAGKILKAALRGGDTAFHAEADTDQAL